MVGVPLLILALDQFPRSLWRATPGAYAQDIKAARLCIEGIENGHFDALDAFYGGRRSRDTVATRLNMTADGVKTLLIAGANPVYDAPTSIPFAEALGKVGLCFHDRQLGASVPADPAPPARPRPPAQG